MRDDYLEFEKKCAEERLAARDQLGRSAFEAGLYERTKMLDISYESSKFRPSQRCCKMPNRARNCTFLAHFDAVDHADRNLSSSARTERQSKMGEKRVSRTAKLRKVFGHPPHRAKTPLRAGLYARVSIQDQQPSRCRPVPCGNTLLAPV